MTVAVSGAATDGPGCYVRPGHKPLSRVGSVDVANSARMTVAAVSSTHVGAAPPLKGGEGRKVEIKPL